MKFLQKILKINTDEECTLAYQDLQYVKDHSDVELLNFSDTHDDDTNER